MSDKLSDLPYIVPDAALVQRIYDHCTDMRACCVGDGTGDGAVEWAPRLRIGNQSFGVGDFALPADEADWMRRQLAFALARLVEAAR